LRAFNSYFDKSFFIRVNSFVILYFYTKYF
jgi:hypothetical protein